VDLGFLDTPQMIILLDPLWSYILLLLTIVPRSQNAVIIIIIIIIIIINICLKNLVFLWWSG
jgi:CHASE2 domain-containing sensor protein